MISSSPIYAFSTVASMSTIGFNYSDPGTWITSEVMGTTGVRKPRKKVYRPKKVYKDGPYVPEPQLAKDPNVFQFIAKAIGEWFNGKSKTKNTTKSVEGVTKEAPWKEESITASEQSGTPYSGLSGEV